MKKLRVGTRKSLLSARQTELALAALAKVHPALETEIVPFHTRGDLILDKPLWAISNEGKGVFASEFEEMLLRDEIDIAIHSGKDLPVLLADGLEIIGVLNRMTHEMCLLCRRGKKLRLVKSSARAAFVGSSARQRFSLGQNVGSFAAIFRRVCKS